MTNAAFLFAVERRKLVNLRPCGILSYNRYHDDITVVGSTREQLVSFCSELVHDCEPFVAIANSFS